jgi:hypothetical protein
MPFFFIRGQSITLGKYGNAGETDIPISFIGKKYGRRGEIVDYILENNIPIQTGGIGFGKPLESGRNEKCLRAVLDDLGGWL